MKDIYPKEKRKQNISCEYPFDVDFHQFDWVLILDTGCSSAPTEGDVYNIPPVRKSHFFGIIGWGTYGSDYARVKTVSNQMKDPKNLIL